MTRKDGKCVAKYLIVKLDGLRKLVSADDPVETDKPSPTGTGVFNVTKATYGADPPRAWCDSYAGTLQQMNITEVTHTRRTRVV